MITTFKQDKNSLALKKKQDLNSVASLSPKYCALSLPKSIFYAFNNFISKTNTCCRLSLYSPNAAFVQCASLICCIQSCRLIGSTRVCCDPSRCVSVRMLDVHYNILKMCSQKIPHSSLYAPDCKTPRASFRRLQGGVRHLASALHECMSAIWK